MNVLEGATPQLPVAEAVRLASELYGLDAEARSLPGEYDDNFHLTTKNGQEYVLKVMRACCDPGLVDLQVGALTHLAQQAPTLNLPRVIDNGEKGPVATAGVSDGSERLVWMLSYVPGKTLAETRPHPHELLFDLGRYLGELDKGLSGFEHAGARRELKWDLCRAGWVREYIHHIADAERRALVEKFLSLYDEVAAPVLPGSRRSVIHNDANDHNVVVEWDESERARVATVIDFGDMVETVTVSEVAVAAAYALLGKRQPLAAAAQVVTGYHSAHPLEEKEIALLFPLICARLCVSVVNSAYRKTIEPDDPYVTISEAPAWEALERLSSVHPRFARYTLRHVCGLTPVESERPVMAWLGASKRKLSPVLDLDPASEPSIVLDNSVGSRLLGADPMATVTDRFTKILFGEMEAHEVRLGIGRWDEARLLYTGEAYASGAHATDERRTVHLGIDLFVEAGTRVHAPLDGTVHLVAHNAAPKDYGPLIILRHATDDGTEFYTLYGHLSLDSLDRVEPGQTIAKGDVIADIGAPPVNGDWPAHLHFQIILDLLEMEQDFPGVAYASQRAVWTSLSPHPNVILRIPAERFPRAEMTSDEMLESRRALLGANLSISYRQPLNIVRGWMQFLYDDSGRAYLDAYNNVPHVGHSHPRVAQAAAEQMALLNTNTRYLHENILRYAERLTALLPGPLQVCFFVNSGSEANELAIRIARAHTEGDDLIVLDDAYHGHTTLLTELSPAKLKEAGGREPEKGVHVAPMPDDYRGEFRRDDPERGRKYAAKVGEILDRIRQENGKPAAFLCESLPSVGGQIVLPPEYLAEVYRLVRDQGGVCIADEVQVGFGRLGEHFWGFESQGVVPDIVVMGKPMGNGHPLGAVVTTREIAESFAGEMEFFSTFGGNPVSCAAGLAVLDVIEQDSLQAHALDVGEDLKGGLQGLMEKHESIGDVRGMGFFLGVELVHDRQTLEPAGRQASYVVNRLRERGILTGTDGPYHNVIKIRPPLPFSQNDASHFIRVLDGVLGEDPARAGIGASNSPYSSGT